MRNKKLYIGNKFLFLEKSREIVLLLLLIVTIAITTGMVCYLFFGIIVTWLLLIYKRARVFRFRHVETKKKSLYRDLVFS